jgi:hypothetical protein
MLALLLLLILPPSIPKNLHTLKKLEQFIMILIKLPNERGSIEINSANIEESLNSIPTL